MASKEQPKRLPLAAPAVMSRAVLAGPPWICRWRAPRLACPPVGASEAVSSECGQSAAGSHKGAPGGTGRCRASLGTVACKLQLWGKPGPSGAENRPLFRAQRLSSVWAPVENEPLARDPRGLHEPSVTGRG